MRGVLISLEGIEGSGKTTQSRMLAEHLRRAGHQVVETVEPGGTRIGLKVRELLLEPEHTEMHHLTELLLYNAARVQHLQEVILPAIERGEIVVTDRFSDSTMAYQGFGRGIDPQLIASIDSIATGGLKPDLTLLLDTDVESGLSRNRSAQKVDRFELEEVAFHERVRKGFIQIATHEPGRVRIIDCGEGIGRVHQEVVKNVDDCLSARGLR